MTILPVTPAPRNAVLRMTSSDSAMPLLSGGEVIISYPKMALWNLSFTLPPMEWELARAWTGALSELAILENTFNFGPPGYRGPSTSYSGSAPLVNGAGQTGYTLVCDGVDASEDILLRGDYLSVNGELQQLATDATSNGSGSVTFTFTRPIKSAPPDNALVEIDEPVGVFRLANPRSEWSIDVAVHYGVSIDAVESIRK